MVWRKLTTIASLIGCGPYRVEEATRSYLAMIKGLIPKAIYRSDPTNTSCDKSGRCVYTDEREG
ncbi:hypothetical protein EP10_001573 [Geobacillus icigianus]|uniref:Uncharacterized protein n=1 Tax=Geobacillus icigianus TaxID=1430331 RepID=A0ABU6BFI5_9BACL|nr:hypothetical protein [Geobacillus icigianus]